MGFYVVWPSLVITIVIVGLAKTPLPRPADLSAATARARVRTIDGLRGFLALAVFFHHASIYHRYLLTGDWVLPPSRFYTNLGQCGVTMFFMITGYLFWAQMLRSGGKPEFLTLYIGRVFRIAPLYLLLGLFVLLSAGVMTGWHLNEPSSRLTINVLNWLDAGVFLAGDVNGYATIGVSAGVTWSLPYEWAFYASLLLTASFARRRLFGALLPVVGLLTVTPLSLLFPGDLPLISALMFLIGMAVASTRQIIVAEPLPIWRHAMSLGVVACLVLALLGFDGVYSVLPVMILGMAFALVVFGATIFGLLLTRSAKRLGDISYGIYLLQGPALFLAFSSHSVRSFGVASAWGHWIVVTIAAVALVMLATVAHRLIERPGIEAGQRVRARISSIRRLPRSIGGMKAEY